MARACNPSPSEAEVEVLDGEIWELGLGVWVVLPSWCPQLPAGTTPPSLLLFSPLEREVDFRRDPEGGKDHSMVLDSLFFFSQVCHKAV